MCRQAKVVMDSAEDNATYNKARKRYLEGKGLINCSYCHYHRGENASYHKNRNWKRKGKARKQYLAWTL